MQLQYPISFIYMRIILHTERICTVVSTVIYRVTYEVRTRITMQYVNDNGIPNRVFRCYDTVFACSVEGGGESALASSMRHTRCSPADVGVS